LDFFLFEVHFGRYHIYIYIYIYSCYVYEEDYDHEQMIGIAFLALKLEDISKKYGYMPIEVT
jgi:hypothetical protein